MEFVTTFQQFLHSPLHHQIINLGLRSWTFLIAAGYPVSDILCEAMKLDESEIFLAIMKIPWDQELATTELLKQACYLDNDLYFTTLLPYLQDPTEISLWLYQRRDRRLKEFLLYPGMIQKLENSEFLQPVIQHLNERVPGWIISTSDLAQKSLRVYLNSLF